MAQVTELTVLHAVRLTGVAATAVVAGRLGAESGEVELVLRHGAASGLVRHRGGTLQGWALTADGRVRLETLLAAELDALGRREALEVAYGEFLVLNPEVLRVCSDWQVLRSGEPVVLNDHLDPDYDRHVLERLADLHEASLPMLVDLAGALGRFSGYRPRFDAALRRAGAGELEWVTKPLIDSYHTVWFELHEDLLATLGRRRSDERDNGTPTIGGGPTT